MPRVRTRAFMIKGFPVNGFLTVNSFMGLIKLDKETVWVYCDPPYCRNGRAASCYGTGCALVGSAAALGRSSVFSDAERILLARQRQSRSVHEVHCILSNDSCCTCAIIVASKCYAFASRGSAFEPLARYSMQNPARRQRFAETLCTSMLQVQTHSF